MEIEACHASLPKLLGVTSTNSIGQPIGPTLNLTSYTSASGVDGHPVAHPPKISQIKGSRPQPRKRTGCNM
ncbi:hypothetical protein CRG98_035757 [Punica granatum]|uniref:Uncharacterized protein n=1 Tax=Punica granatum TaxID=22663 RepID=A0A2I0IJJ0_PUNGR|nr:hypothetical protein CRG98_035757 [Punica granatum]